MIYRLLILLFIISCGEFKFSPYQIDITDKDLNSLNLQRILNLSKFNTKSEQFKIAIISDTHDYYDGLNKQINYINKNHDQFDFVIITGDMTNVGLVSEYEATIDRLNRLIIPYITLIGNHDLLIDGEKIYKKFFGSSDYSFEYKNTKFILFNNNNWESSASVPNLPWIESELVSRTKDHVLLFSHVAPDDPERFTKSQINELRGLVDRYGVSHYINGHNHNPAESIFGKAKQVTVGASVKNVLVELTINTLGVEHAFINL